MDKIKLWQMRKNVVNWHILRFFAGGFSQQKCLLYTQLTQFISITLIIAAEITSFRLSTLYPHRNYLSKRKWREPSHYRHICWITHLQNYTSTNYTNFNSTSFIVTRFDSEKLTKVGIHFKAFKVLSKNYNIMAGVLKRTFLLKYICS